MRGVSILFYLRLRVDLTNGAHNRNLIAEITIAICLPAHLLIVMVMILKQIAVDICKVQL